MKPRGAVGPDSWTLPRIAIGMSLGLLDSSAAMTIGEELPSSLSSLSLASSDLSLSFLAVVSSGRGTAFFDAVVPSGISWTASAMT